MKKDRNMDRLYDIIDSIDKINLNLKKSKFYQLNDLEQLGIVYLLQIIGEAARQITNQFQKKQKQIPWAQIIGFRNFVVHQYAEVDMDVIRSVIEKDLSILKKQILKIINE